MATAQGQTQEEQHAPEGFADLHTGARLFFCQETWAPEMPAGAASSSPSSSSEEDKEPPQLYVVYGHGLTESSAEASKYVRWDVVMGGGGLPCRPRSTLLTYDARGHGASCAPEDPNEYQWTTLAADQVALVDRVWGSSAQGLVVSAGASMGCATALNVALQRPETVKKLVLIIPPTAWEMRPPRVSGYIACADMCRDRGSSFLLEAAKVARPPAPFTATEDEVDAFRLGRARSLAAMDATRLERVFRGAAHNVFPTREDIATIQAPTLILAWTDDRSHPVEVAREMASLMPHATLHVAMTRADFDEWSTLVAAFLDQA